MCDSFHERSDVGIRIKKYANEFAEAKTGFDIFKNLKDLCSIYGFEWFSIASFPSPIEETYKLRVFVNNWHPELVERISAVPDFCSFVSVVQVRSSNIPIVLRFDDLSENTGERGINEIFQEYGHDFALFLPLRSLTEFNGSVALSGRGESPSAQVVMEVAYLCNHFHEPLNQIVKSRSSAVEKLSSTQISILQLLAEGHNSKELTGKLSISASTVSYHLRGALALLGAKTPAHAVAIACMKGLFRTAGG
ncbi:helix-turn-helix transcriptional regulator [Mesorhizobium sp. Z1-4]|uniref:helix-turn-helix transcriptional regulator n=1 Tax=Mesorhizobium sp. Z1-4 TaxID=2448478 RepID=UPI000FDC4A1A|nr:helix-turn-helix transcriptional regulator [Mesorhizobium sp. Z1-4]